MQTLQLMPHAARRRWGAVLKVAAAALVAGLFLVEAYEAFEASFGSDEWFSAVGKGFAYAGVGCLFLQYVVTSRAKVLDRIFGLNNLFTGHRVVAWCAAGFLLLHPVFIFSAPEHDFQFKYLLYWPLGLGAITLVSVWTAVLVAWFRKPLGLAFDTWFSMHRMGVLALPFLAGVHFAFIHDHVHLILPHYVLAAGLAVYVAGRFARDYREYEVARVHEVGRDTFGVHLAPRGEAPAYAPGQFAFVTFRSKGLPEEEHPWTISSAPAANDELIFTIKRSGDFTERIGELIDGDSAMVEAPFGLFSYQALPDPGADLLLVAGGVGVTPFLSMLRQLAAEGDTRRVTLVWSNREEADILWREEIGELEKSLPGLKVHHVLTRQPDHDGPTGHLDAKLLAELASGLLESGEVFICGPPAMMDALVSELAAAGVDKARLHTERFAL